MFSTEPVVPWSGVLQRGAARLLLMLGCVFNLTACASGPELSTVVTCGAGYRIATSAKIGCRSPDDPGCSTCCSSTGAGCTQLSWDEAGVSGVRPWYNTSQNTAACPQSCPPCASCLTRDEGVLCSLLTAPRDCDCATINLGSTPCTTNGCECYCYTRDYLTKACHT